MHRISTLTAGSAIIAMLGFAVPAMAECQNGKSDTQAGKANEEIVAEAKTDPETGKKEAATGGAEPTENWFGCKPDSEGYEECISRKGRDQEEKAGESAPKSDTTSAMKSGSGSNAKKADNPGMNPDANGKSDTASGSAMKSESGISQDAPRATGSDRMADAEKEDCPEDRKKG